MSIQTKKKKLIKKVNVATLSNNIRKNTPVDLLSKDPTDEKWRPRNKTFYQKGLVS